LEDEDRPIIEVFQILETRQTLPHEFRPDKKSDKERFPDGVAFDGVGEADWEGRWGTEAAEKERG
jgi:hypothetical protein